MHQAIPGSPISISTSGMGDRSPRAGSDCPLIPVGQVNEAFALVLNSPAR